MSLPNPPEGVQRVTTRLTYQDPERALQFLADAFGFAEIPGKRVTAANGIIVTEIAIGDAYVMIGRAGGHDLISPRQSGPTASMMVYVDDVDAHHQQAQAGGTQIVADPADQYWGDRRYEARDLEGHVWFFHQRVREVSAEEIAQIEASFLSEA